MKLHRLLPILASLALVACLRSPAPAARPPTEQLPTISALLPTTLAAFRLPAAQEPSSTPFPSPTLAAYPGPATAAPYTPLPPAPIIGRHIVQRGETIFCIARGYGVLPAAIAQANGLSQTFNIAPGQMLTIPAVQWSNIAEGPVCATQFQSPFPGLVVPTATLAAYPMLAMPPLAVMLNFNCVANCGARDGDYVVRLQVMASGGLQPYGYIPAQTYDVSVPHCANGQGSVTITSADGQTAQAGWVYNDTSCN